MSNPARFTALIKPCNNRPFVVANHFPLSPGRREEIAHSLASGATFFCHQTVDYSNDEGDGDTISSARCFGAASVLHKSGMAPMASERLAMRLGLAEPVSDNALQRPDTFDTLGDFAQGH